MGAITYRLELDAERHPTLVKENEVSYYDEPITEPAYIVELCDKLVRLRFLAEERVGRKEDIKFLSEKIKNPILL